MRLNIRFRLKTLLIVGTLVCVMLGTYGQQLLILRREHQRQMEAASVISSHGGKVSWAHRPTRLIWTGGYDQCVTVIDLRDWKALQKDEQGIKPTPLASAAYDAIADCSELDYLVLEGRQIDSQGLAKVQRCKRLRAINFAYCDWNNSTVQTLSKISSVEQLQLTGTSITNDDVAHLLRMPQLRELGLSRCPVTEELTFEHGKARLVSLTLHSTRVSDRTLARLLTQQPTIEELGLLGTKITDESIPALSKMDGLKQLDLGFSALSPAGIERLKADLPDCDIQFRPR